MPTFDLDTLTARKLAQYGKFDPSDLAPAFLPYYRTGRRIKVRFGDGDTLTGTVGMTTGWRPAFLLMRTARSTGSPYLLRPEHAIVAVKVGRYYRPA